MSLDFARINMSKREALLHLLSDLEWHGHHELAMVAGVRYSARLLELKRLGYTVESEPASDGEQGKRYRLTSLAVGASPPKRVKVLLAEEDVATMVERGYVPPLARDALTDARASFLTNREKL